MFPLYDDNTDLHSWPIVNIVLIALNVLVFVVFQGLGSNNEFTLAFSTVPAEIRSGKDIVTDNREVEVRTPAGPQTVLIPGLQRTPIPVYLTILTSMFMHGGLAHIAGNMWFLWIFGDNIENDLGKLRYLLFYLATGVAASLAHVLTNLTGPSAEIPSLGASGAISGVMGAYLLLHPQRRVTVMIVRFVTEVPAFIAVGMWFAFQVVQGLGMLGGAHSGVAYGAHIGGFVAGMALIYPFLLGRTRPMASSRGWSGDYDTEERYR